MFAFLFSLFTLTMSAPVCSAAEQVIKLRLNEMPELLDWGAGVRGNEAPYVMNLMEGLYRINAKGAYESALSGKLEISKDQTVYTFRLSPKAKWSDGRPVYAADFLYAWTRVLSPNSISPYFNYLYDIKNAEAFHLGKVKADALGITAVDDFTLKVELKQSVLNWHELTAFWAMFPVRRDQLEKYGAKFTRPGILVSTGPYVFESYTDHKEAVLKRNPHYPQFEKLVPSVKVLLDIASDRVCSEFAKGNIQVSYEPYRCKDKALNIPLKKIVFMTSNIARFPTNNVLFRKAVFNAVVIDESFAKYGYRQSSSFFPRGLIHSKSETFSYNAAKAKEFLIESNLKLDKKLVITLLGADSERDVALGKRVKEQIEKTLGLNVNLMSLPKQSYLLHLMSNDYHFLLTTWTAKVPNPQDFMRPFLESDKNSYGTMNPIFSQVVAEATASKTEQDSEALFLKAESLIAKEDSVARVLFNDSYDVLVNSSLRGVYFDHMGLPYFRQATLR